jgi:pSer/pThr/pTyr-binding forkhead associated (FHA) protein
MAELQEKELERRLNLYQVFLKLYEHHGSLLDEILQLENLYQPSFGGVKSCYVQGIVDGSLAYAISNLGEGKTQTLRQPQQIWTIGRDRNCGIYIAERYVSRRHAAIQYIDNQGFYLIDFNSTNGSFVNGEPVYQPLKLKDGDRIRLGNITFSFFITNTCRLLPTVAVELLMQLVPRMGSEVEIVNSAFNRQKTFIDKPSDTVEIFRESGFLEKLEHLHDSLSFDQKSEILDRFLSKQAPNGPS